MNKRWSPPEKSHFIRALEADRFQHLRWHPDAHEPFFKRLKGKKKFTPKSINKFVYAHNCCGAVKPYARFLIKHAPNRLDWRLVLRYYYKKYVRVFVPKTISPEVYAVQPMTAPTGQIFTIRPRYTYVEPT